MVNYLYELDRMERNREAFAHNGEIASSYGVRRHLRGDFLKRFKNPS